ncbi:HXXEE domain-containing protein [Domibacillus indicus]|uniref:HXXEE domain-containing protein n=1 Tax=Domibacillus indicus TaxID=1437523 RepID=UPI000617CAD8|nr:HXXEE domain-containing protein [Domibacillus indicus]
MQSVSKWLLPVLFLVHNVEEMLGMPAFLNSRFETLLITRRQFTAAVVLLTALVFFFVFFLGHSTARLLFVYGAIFFNALQHIVLVIGWKVYHPGALSAAAIILAFLFWLKQAEVPLGKRKTRWTLLGSLLAGPPAVWLSLWIGSWF